MRTMLLTYLVLSWSSSATENLQELLIGTWEGPKWSQTLVARYAGTVDPERDFGPLTLRFEWKGNSLIGRARSQSASVDAEGQAWLYPPHEFPIGEIKFHDNSITFKITEESRSQRYEMTLRSPERADLTLVSFTVKGHGEITPSRRNRPTILQKTK